MLTDVFTRPKRKTIVRKEVVWIEPTKRLVMFLMTMIFAYSVFCFAGHIAFLSVNCADILIFVFTYTFPAVHFLISFLSISSTISDFSLMFSLFPPDRELNFFASFLSCEMRMKESFGEKCEEFPFYRISFVLLSYFSIMLYFY